MLSDREIRRMTEQRIVTIDEVNVENNHITMRDQYNTILYASLDFSSPIVTLPAQGETWIAARTNTSWHLVKKNITSNSLTYFDPGSTLITGDLRVDGKILWGDIGSPWDTNLYRVAARQLKTDGAVTTVGNLDILLGAGDANSHIRLQRDGTGKPGLFLGPGGATALDTNLYRSAADSLKTDDSFLVDGPLFQMAASTTLRFTADTNLYRSAAGILKTDGELDVGSAVFANKGLAWQTALGGGGSGLATIFFGSALDTYLYRATAGQLKTDGLFIAMGSVYSQPTGSGGGFIYNPSVAGGSALDSIIQGEANPRFLVDSNGKTNWGAGGASATDTNLYRVAAGVLRTDTALDMGAGKVRVSDSSVASGYSLGFNFDTYLYRAAAGVLKTDGAVATGSYGTAFPASPVNGQEYTLVDSVTTPTYTWRFRYNASSTSTYKWEFIGGNPVEGELGTNINVSSSFAWPTFDFSQGPAFTVPRSGIYLASIACNGVNLTVGQAPMIVLGINSAYQDTSVTYAQTTAASAYVALYRTISMTLATGDVIRMGYTNYPGGSSQYDRRVLIVQPRQLI